MKVRPGIVVLTGACVAVAGVTAWANTGWGSWHLVLPVGIALAALASRGWPGVPLAIAWTGAAGIAAVALAADGCLLAPLVPGQTAQPSLAHTAVRTAMGLEIATVGAALSGTVGLWLARRARQPEVAWRALSFVALAMTVVLTLASLVPALHRPAPAGYLASLPSLPVASERLATGKTRVVFDGGRWAGWGCQAAPFDDETSAAPVGTIEWHRRQMDLVPSPDHPPEPISPPLPMAHVEVHRDASRALTLVMCAASDGAPMRLVDPTSYASLSAVRLASSLAPPWAWILAAGLGVLAGAGFFARGLRHVRELAQWRLAGEAVHHGDGRVEVEGLGVLQVPSATGLRAGPILIEVQGLRDPAGYRESASVARARVLPGPRSAAEAWLRDRAAGAFAVSAAVVLGSAAPLWVAAARGLV